MSFGFAVGDFIVGLQIAYDLYQTWSDSNRNASTEFRRFVDEFGRFQALLHAYSGPLDGRADLGPGYQETIANCRAFVEKHTALTGADRSAAGRIERAYRTLQWPTERAEVERLRSQYMSYVQFDHVRTSQATLKSSQDTLKAVLQLTENLEHYLAVNAHPRPLHLSATWVNASEPSEWSSALTGLLRRLGEGADISHNLAELEKSLDLGGVDPTNPLVQPRNRRLLTAEDKADLIWKLSERIDNLTKRERAKAVEDSIGQPGLEPWSPERSEAHRGLSELHDFISNSLLRTNPPPPPSLRPEEIGRPRSVVRTMPKVRVKCKGMDGVVCEIQVIRNADNDIQSIRSVGGNGQLSIEHTPAPDSATPWLHHSIVNTPLASLTAYFRGRHRTVISRGSQHQELPCAPDYIFTDSGSLRLFQSILLQKNYILGLGVARVASKRGTECDSEVIRLLEDPTTSLRSLLFFSNSRRDPSERVPHDFDLSAFQAKTKTVNEKTVRLTFGTNPRKTSIFGRRNSSSTSASSSHATVLQSKMQYLEITFAAPRDLDDFLTEFRNSFSLSRTSSAGPLSPKLDGHFRNSMASTPELESSSFGRHSLAVELSPTQSRFSIPATPELDASASASSHAAVAYELDARAYPSELDATSSPSFRTPSELPASRLSAFASASLPRPPPLPVPFKLPAASLDEASELDG